ncbi:MAG TPA: Arc family DNA-binding protein [Actinocrinis sp.]|jgi:plasmid stability protein|uniref:FitA-like ribbon-helix-helix domain-containing protein n=1 Tax=Actinocrinis sp. TaxID=1920516 RepID=UPI002DDDBD12|nr:Arc family DNA-binding protein [Actinocrinis sp.]HEV3173582.1 Arc family DNA-binding protein [Actinocrinis sp.]
MADEEEITSNLTIRGIPAKVRKTLAARAKDHHQSLNSYIVERLTLDAETPTMAEAIARLEATRVKFGVTSDDVVAAVRAVRDEEDAKWG